jgi:pyroglutamyl-peptidase
MGSRLFLLLCALFGLQQQSFAQAPVRVLVSGYEPFEGRTENRTLDVVAHLRETLAGSPLSSRVDLHTMILPVEFRTAHVRLIDEIRAVRPSVVLSLGEALDYDALTIEERAKNYDYAISRDNDGWRFRGPILPGAPQFLPTTLPVPRLVPLLTQRGIPAQASTDAGAFVCNHALYLTLHWAMSQSQQRPANIGLIHVPGPQVPLAQVTRGLMLILEQLVP